MWSVEVGESRKKRDDNMCVWGQRKVERPHLKIKNYISDDFYSSGHISNLFNVWIIWNTDEKKTQPLTLETNAGQGDFLLWYLPARGLPGSSERFQRFSPSLTHWPASLFGRWSVFILHLQQLHALYLPVPETLPRRFKLCPRSSATDQCHCMSPLSPWPKRLIILF